MQDKEREKQRDMEIESMIDRYNMEDRCALTREQIRRRVHRGMVLNNLLFVFADVVNSLLRDMEAEIGKLGIGLSFKEKYNFGQMMQHIKAAVKWSEKSAMPIYTIKDADDAIYDSDFWYHLILLVDDRLGDDAQKTNMTLEYLLNMPKGEDLFGITYEDFAK